METRLKSITSFELYVNFKPMNTISNRWLIAAVVAFFVLLSLFAYMVFSQPEEKYRK